MNPVTPIQTRKRLLGRSLAVVFVVAISAVPTYSWAASHIHSYIIAQQSYKAKYGSWSQVKLPSGIGINTVHASLLKNGDILMIAGSGNDQAFFDAGTFKSLLFDPATKKFTKIPTPIDMFCGGHVELPNGNLLVAGGTQRYENLTPKNAGGSMTVTNETPDKSFNIVATKRNPPTASNPLGSIKQLGTVFYDYQTNQQYTTGTSVTIAPAVKTIDPTTGAATVTHTQTNVWVDAIGMGKVPVITKATQFGIKGLTGSDTRNLYGQSASLTLQKQDFQGLKDAYIFDVATLRYVKVNSMNYARWYPTLTEMGNGMIMTTSGLDDTGKILEGQNEILDPATMTWTNGPTKDLPTYPAVYQTTTPNVLFFTGSNAGYGPATPDWRNPGLWNVLTNTFTPVTGMPDQNLVETSASVLLAPAQKQMYMVMGGGGVGESTASSMKTRLINLLASVPKWIAGPNLLEPTRYPIVVTLPNDQELVTGGSKDYRGKHDSDNRDALLYTPTTNAFTTAAAPLTGRDYHSGGVLTEQGYVVTFGGNPLFADKNDTITGIFNQEIDVYKPPYLFSQQPAPVITQLPSSMNPSSTHTIQISNATDIKALRLVHPSSVTHVTDVNQRSIAVPFTVTGKNELSVTIPDSSDLIPPGYYMFFAVSKAGVPSTGHMVDIPQS